MLARKVQNTARSTKDSLPKIHLNIEDVLENLTDWMFKIILYVGIPYFLFVLIQFLRMVH